jgi:hypothetical protein
VTPAERMAKIKALADDAHRHLDKAEHETRSARDAVARQQGELDELLAELGDASG